MCLKGKQAMANTRTLYFDESGNTGPNLLDPQQKFFSVGSTDLTEGESSALLQRYFPKHFGGDIKFKKLFRDASNYDGLIGFAENVGRQPERFFCFFMDKKFALLCRLIDWLVEPLFHDRSYDWYKDDYGRSWANIFHLAFKTLDDNEALLTEVTGLYSDLVREPSYSLLEKMKRRYREIATTGPHNIREFMYYVAMGADEFETRYAFDGMKNHTDIHVSSLVSSVGWWRSQYVEDFDIVHDESTYFFKRQGLWDMITSMAASNAVVNVGQKSIRFPLRVRSTMEGSSQKLASLQISDLIGGFVARSKADNLTSEQHIVINTMIERGLGRIGLDCVVPGDFYAQGMPPRADGPDAVDQIVIAMRQDRTQT